PAGWFHFTPHPKPHQSHTGSPLVARPRRVTLVFVPAPRDRLELGHPGDRGRDTSAGASPPGVSPALSFPLTPPPLVARHAPRTPGGSFRSHRPKPQIRQGRYQLRRGGHPLNLPPPWPAWTGAAGSDVPSTRFFHPPSRPAGPFTNAQARQRSKSPAQNGMA